MALSDEDRQKVHDYIYERFPQLTWALEHPELGKILEDASEQSWDTSRLYGALVKTDYWKSNPESARALENLKANDPATWNQMISQEVARFEELGRTLGVPLGAAAMKKMAEESLTQGYTVEQQAQQYRAELAKTAFPEVSALQAGEIGGEIGATFGQLEDLAREYEIGLSSRDLQDWLRNITLGDRSVESFEQYVQTVAAQEFPWLADQLKQGATTRTLLNPYRNWVGEALEVNADTIDFRKPKYHNLLFDQESGRQRNLHEVHQQVRATLPEWRRTKQAHDEVGNLATKILERFGKVA